MPAAVVPPQHALKHSLSDAKPEDALNVCSRSNTSVIGLGIVVEKLRKESCRRELPAVPDDDHLFRARNSSERVDRIHLDGLVDEQKVECQQSGFEELGN